MVYTGWATSEERAFLQTWIPEYETCQLNRRYKPFWNKVTTEYFRRFPAIDRCFPGCDLSKLNDDDQKLYANTVQRQQQRIKEWYRWQMHPRGRGTVQTLSKKDFQPTSKPEGRTRDQQPYEIFAKAFPKEVENAMDRHCAPEGMVGREKLDLWHAVVKELYEHAPEEQVQKVADLIRENEEMDVNSADPSTFLRHLKKLPALLDATITPAVRKAGVMALVTIVGPDPEHNGEIRLKTLQFGDKRSTPLFSDEWADHDGLFMDEVARFVRRHEFPPGVCAARSMNPVSIPATESHSVNGSSIDPASLVDAISQAITLTPPLDSDVSPISSAPQIPTNLPTVPLLVSDPATPISLNATPIESWSGFENWNDDHWDIYDASFKAMQEGEELKNKHGSTMQESPLDRDPNDPLNIRVLNLPTYPGGSAFAMFGSTVSGSDSSLSSFLRSPLLTRESDERPDTSPGSLQNTYAPFSPPRYPSDILGSPPSHLRSSPPSQPPSDLYSLCSQSRHNPLSQPPSQPPGSFAFVGPYRTSTFASSDPSPTLMSGPATDATLATNSSNLDHKKAGALKTTIYGQRTQFIGGLAPTSSHAASFLHSLINSAPPIPPIVPLLDMPFIDPNPLVDPTTPIYPITPVSPLPLIPTVNLDPSVDPDTPVGHNPRATPTPSVAPNPHVAPSTPVTCNTSVSPNAPVTPVTPVDPIVPSSSSDPPNNTPPSAARADLPANEEGMSRRSTRGVVPSKRNDRLQMIGSSACHSPVADVGSGDAQPAWFTAAMDNLRSYALIDGLQNFAKVIQLWGELERLMGYGNVGKGSLPTSGRPQEWKKWISKSWRGNRCYDKVPTLNDTTDIGKATLKWWTSIQPSFRTSGSDFPLSVYIPPDSVAGDPWISIRKSGPNGFVSMIMLLAWWGEAAKNKTGQWQENSLHEWIRVSDDVLGVLGELIRTNGADVPDKRAKRQGDDMPNATSALKKRHASLLFFLIERKLIPALPPGSAAS